MAERSIQRAIDTLSDNFQNAPFDQQTLFLTCGDLIVICHMQQEEIDQLRKVIQGMQVHVDYANNMVIDHIMQISKIVNILDKGGLLQKYDQE